MLWVYLSTCIKFGLGVGYSLTGPQITGSQACLRTDLSLGRLSSLIIYIPMTGWPNLSWLICTKVV